MSKPWLETLNEQQRSAATHVGGPLLVIAGAGTGKTTTLAARVAYLIDQGVSPDRVLLLTFTRRAAAEMVKRAADLTGARHTGRVWAGTFHAVANRLLRVYGEALGIGQQFTILDQSDAADLMNMIRADLGVAKGQRRFPRKETLLAIYSRSVAAQERLGDVLDKRFPWCAKEAEGIRRIFEVYTGRKRDLNLLDYDDLLLYWKVLTDSNELGRSVADRFEHILVDEYQDTNTMQADILRNLRRDNGSITVVGDDAQAIYSFRAATVRNIIGFPDDFSGTTIIRLEQNYRSVQAILDASNAVMGNASQRFAKELWSVRKAGEKPYLIHCRDEPDQCACVCKSILEHLEQGIPLMKQAVLFRAGHHSDQLEVELARRNIPFRKYGGLKFVESAHIKDMLAFLRVLENPADQLSWFRILLMFEGVGPQTARRVVEAIKSVFVATAVDCRQTLFAALSSKPPNMPAAARDAFVKLTQALSECAVASERDSGQTKRGALAAQVERIRQFYEPFFELRYENASVRIRDLEQMEQIAASYSSRERFLSDLTLDPPASTADFAQPPHLDEDYLILSTIHSAKGCEWDVVHILHVADGMIPSDMAVADQEGIDEERRLLYVAMTRAKDRLYLYFPLRYYHTKHARGDGHTYAQLSRYLTKPVQSFFEHRSSGKDDFGEGEAVIGCVDRVDDLLRGLWRS